MRQESRDRRGERGSSYVIALLALFVLDGVATAEAILTANAIEPGSATNFRAIFQGVYTFASAKFEIRSAP